MAAQGPQGLGEPEQSLGPVVAEAQRQRREVEAGLEVAQVELGLGEVGEQPANLGLPSNFRRLDEEWVFVSMKNFEIETFCPKCIKYED